MLSVGGQFASANHTYSWRPTGDFLTERILFASSQPLDRSGLSQIAAIGLLTRINVGPMAGDHANVRNREEKVRIFVACQHSALTDSDGLIRGRYRFVAVWYWAPATHRQQSGPRGDSGIARGPPSPRSRSCTPVV